MKTEMDVLNMDERQRQCWLLANRVTLCMVAIIWLGLIAVELIQHKLPYFMIIMVPVFAVVRLSFYLYYSKKI